MQSTASAGEKRAGSNLMPMVVLLLILLLAAYLRWYKLGYAFVGGDQSILLNIAMRYVNGGELPLAANKSSAGIMNPPFIVYLLAAPLFVQSALQAVHLFLGLIGFGAVLALALYARWLFGWRVAILATLLLATNPWAVHYSRFIWNPNPIPFFATLLLFSLIAIVLDRQRALHIVLMGFSLAAITQLHLSGLVMVFVTGLTLLLFGRSWLNSDWRRLLLPFLLGAGVALLLYWPFIQFEKAVAYADLRAVATALTGQAANSDPLGVGEAETNAASFLLVQELATGNGIEHVLGLSGDDPPGLAWAEFGARLLFWLSLLYVAVGPFAWLRWRTAPSTHQETKAYARYVTQIILLLWFLVPILLYVRHTVYLQNYYFLYIYPAPAIAGALLIDQALTWVAGEQQRFPRQLWLSRFVAVLLLMPILLLSFWQAGLFQRWFAAVADGTIVLDRQAREVDQAIQTATTTLRQNPACDLTILAEGGTVEQASLGVMEQFLSPTPVRYVDGQRGYIIPADCSIYMTVRDTIADGWLATSGQPLGQTIQAGSEVWRFILVDGAAAPDEVSARWENGLSLLTTEVEGEFVAGSLLTATYTWRVDAVPAPGHYHFFNHLLDSEGAILTQDDAPAVESIYWQVGDQLVTRFYFQLPAELPSGEFSLLVGQYLWPELARIGRQDSPDTTYLVRTFPAVR
ncbi:MAG: hypothetical protein KDE59_23900 [Anaerolineales bacterium]|nr:hypothetical protein [Anaerolineales bacterium]